MCYYITFIFPDNTEISVLEIIETQTDIAFSKEYNSDKFKNYSLESQIQKNEIYLWKESRYCDCGTMLGELERLRNSIKGEANPDNSIAKLKRKGWSLAKINRWIANKETSVANRLRKDQLQIDHIKQDSTEIDQYIHLIKIALARVQYISLLLHWYRKGFDSERYQIKRKIPIAQITKEVLLNIEEDVIYQFVR